MQIYFSGTKRNAFLLNAIKNNQSLSNVDKKRRLQSVTEVRWHSNYAAVKSFLSLYEPVILALETLSDNRSFDEKTAIEAAGLIKNLVCFEAILCAEISLNILNITKFFVIIYKLVY